MAVLGSEDKEVKSSFNLIFIEDKIKNKVAISWVPYMVILQSAGNELIYEKKEKDKGAGDYVFSLTPINEIEILTSGIASFLTNKTKNMFSFEPLEPSFELILERGHKGYSVICWLDAGNVISSHYTWDGFGLRFFTSEEKISLFLKELENESKCLNAKI